MSKYNANRFASLESKESNAPSESNPPRLAAGTMASLTKAKEVNKNAYSTRFSEQSRLRNDPNYVPPQRPVNITSDDDFPTLGTPKVIPLPKQSGMVSMAKEWGKKIEEEEEANRTRIQNAEIQRRADAKEKYMKEKYGTPECRVKSKNGLIIRVKKNQYYDKEQVAFKQIVEENVSDDSFESGPSREDEVEEDIESPDDEFNTNIGYERRHKDELY